MSQNALPALSGTVQPPKCLFSSSFFFFGGGGCGGGALSFDSLTNQTQQMMMEFHGFFSRQYWFYVLTYFSYNLQFVCVCVCVCVCCCCCCCCCCYLGGRGRLGEGTVSLPKHLLWWNFTDFCQSSIPRHILLGLTFMLHCYRPCLSALVNLCWPVPLCHCTVQHHCRLCGRIFCFNCADNWVDSTSSRSGNMLVPIDGFVE